MDSSYNYNYQYSGNIPPETAGVMAVFFWRNVFVFFADFHHYLHRDGYFPHENSQSDWNFQGLVAWIPILNLILMLQIAQRPIWWLIFFLVPIINIARIVLAFVIWVDIAKRLGKSAVFGILAALIPIIFMPYLAFSENDSPPSATTHPPAVS